MSEAARSACPHAAACGACQVLDLPARDQLRLKRDAVARELAAHGTLARARVEPCLPSPKVFGYRNRAKVAVESRGRQSVLVGYYGERSRALVDAPECRVLEPALLATLEGLRPALARLGPHASAVRHLDLRCGSDPNRQHLLVVVDARAGGDIDIERLRPSLRGVTGLSLNLHPGHGPIVVKGPIEHVWGEREVWVELTHASLRVSPGSFFQVNLSILPAIHDRIAEFLRGGRVLLDLYAGVGTHGLALAPSFGSVTCIEGVRRAAFDARASIERSGLRHVEVIASPVERALRAVFEKRPDAVVLNPSREGARPEVLDAIGHGTASRVAYLSCEPRSLARDLPQLLRHGFAVATVLPLDMMPQTRHVEVLALLERDPPRERPRGRPRASPRERPRGRPATRR